VNPEEHLGLARFVAEKYRSARPWHVDMDDVHGACMLGLVKAARTFDPLKGLWAAYASRVMHNEVVMLFRRRVPELLPVDRPWEEPADPDGPEERALARGLLRSWVRRARLTRHQRQMLLGVLLGESNAEIAHRIGVTPNAVRLGLCRVRSRLRGVEHGGVRVPGLRPGGVRPRDRPGAGGGAA
jgi:RNA polymerase sigma factor (sigma-70 family)